MGALLIGVGGGLLIGSLVIAAGTLIAMIAMLTQPTEGYLAAHKMTKGVWLMTGALGFIVPVVGVFVIVAYFLDVRPAVAAASGGSGSSGVAGNPRGPAKG